MRTPKYTDLDRYLNGYATAKASDEPGYLAARFVLIRERQAKNDAERVEKLRTMRKVAN